jgi:signal transduction histidine kinase
VRRGHMLRAVAWAVSRQPNSRSGDRYHPAGRTEVSSLISESRRRRRLHGRLAAMYFSGSGAVGFVTIPILAPGLNVLVTAAISAAAIALGIATWLAPWDIWPRQASLGLVPPAFALIALANSYGGAGPRTYGIFFLVAFVWIGMAHPPWTSAVMAPLAAVAYALPLSSSSVGMRTGIYSTVITIAICVLVGEGIAWSLSRLGRIELALRRERDQTGQLRELDEMKDTFLSTVSHELQTPITICRGHLDVLEEGAGEREVRAVKETLVNELDLMARLVEDLTTFARVDDKTQLRMESLPLDSFVSSITKKAEPILGNRLHVECDVAGATLRADPQRLTQALLNLLRNAAEHTEGDGPVRFHVRAGASFWRFEVADEGGGLPSGDEQVLFEPFRTGSSPTSGTGLGLSIVQGVARAHNGESGVVNRPGHGATFWIQVPWSTS